MTATRVWNPLTLEDLEEGVEYRAWTSGRLFKVTRARPSMFDFEEGEAEGYLSGPRRSVGDPRDPLDGERHDLAVGHEVRRDLDRRPRPGRSPQPGPPRHDGGLGSP